MFQLWNNAGSHPDSEALKRAKEISEEWLADIGLELKPGKSRRADNTFKLPIL